MTDPTFLPGVPVDAVLAALRRSPGNDLATGKFDGPEASTALAANAFGWFLDRPDLLPSLPGVPMGRPESVEVMAEMQLAFSGVRHPWLDAAITSATTLTGVLVTRYQPFRPRKATVFSEPFDSRDWGPGMARYTALRHALTEGRQTCLHLDAVQLVKCAYALRTQSVKRARGAVLVYLHAAPATWASGKPVDPAAIQRHQAEIGVFARSVKGDDVTFVAVRWSELLHHWAGLEKLAAHAAAISARFAPL